MPLPTSEFDWYCFHAGKVDHALISPAFGVKEDRCIVKAEYRDKIDGYVFAPKLPKSDVGAAKSGLPRSDHAVLVVDLEFSTRTS